MRDFCPESELIAAAAEGNLTADEQWRLANHATVCDDCRREWALVQVQRAHEPEAMPETMKFRLRGALARAIRPATGRRTFRTSPTTSPAAALAAVIVVSLAAVLAVLYYKRNTEPSVVILEAPKLKRPVPQENPTPDVQEPERRPPTRDWPPQVPDRRIEEEKKSGEKPELVEKRRDPRAKPPTPREHSTGTTARVFTDLLLTDVSGEVAVVRGKERRPARGFVTVSSGDTIVADKFSSFHIEGRHAVVLPPDSKVTLASSSTEQATWVDVRSGQVLIQPEASSRWVVSDGRTIVMIDRTRGRFAAMSDSAGLALLALSDPLQIQREGGRRENLRPGEEWTVKGIAPSGRASTVQAQLTSNLPRERSLFFATLDPEDGKRGRWSVSDGVLEKEKVGKTTEYFARGVDKRQRQVVSVRLDQRVGWDFDHTVRLRYRTTAKTLRIELPLPQNQGSLLAEIDVSRDAAGRWVTVEIPLSKFQIVGSGRILLSDYDRLESIEVSIAPKETWSGARPYVSIDDLQILER